MEVPPQLPFDHPDFLASMDCEPYPGLHSVPGTVPPDFFINFPPHAPAVFSTHNSSLQIRRLPSAMPCPVIRTNFRHDVIVTAEKYAEKFPQIVEKLEYLPMVWQDLYHFWDPVDLYVEDPGFLFHVLHLIIWNAITVRRRIYSRVKAWCHLNIHKLVDLTALTPVSSVLDQHDWHFLGLSMIPAHEITTTCAQLDLQRVEMREMIEQFAKRALQPAPPQSAEQHPMRVLPQVSDIHDKTLPRVSQNGTDLELAISANHHEQSLGGGASIAPQGIGYIALEEITPPIAYVPSMVAPGSQAMVVCHDRLYSNEGDMTKVRQQNQVHNMLPDLSLPQAHSKVASTSDLGLGVSARPQQTANRKSSGSSATKTSAELRDDTESPIPRVLLPGQTKPAHTSLESAQDVDIGKMHNVEVDWTAAAAEKRLIGIRIADAYDTATILKSDVIPKVLSACGGIVSYRPQISDAKMIFMSPTSAQAALKYNGKAIDSGPSLIVYLIPVWDNSATTNVAVSNSSEKVNGGESFHSPVARRFSPQIADPVHGDCGGQWTASSFAPPASMPYMMASGIGDQPILLAHRPLPPILYRIKSVTSPRVPTSNVNRARGQPNPVGHGLNRPRPRPYQQGYRQSLFSQNGPRYAQRPSSYQYPPANQTRFENPNQNELDTRSSTGTDYGANREPEVSTGPRQSNLVEVPKQENIKTSASRNALEVPKKSRNKDIAVKVTDPGTESKQSAVGIVDLPIAATTVLAVPGVIDKFIAETFTSDFTGNQEHNVYSSVDKSGSVITIPHTYPLQQQVTVSCPDAGRPEIIDELRRQATEFRNQDIRGAGNTEAGLQRLLGTVTTPPTTTTVLMNEPSRSLSTMRLQDIEHTPLDSKATIRGNESFEDSIEVSAEDIRGSVAYVQMPNGGSLGHAELAGASTGDRAVLGANAQTAADAIKKSRGSRSVIEDGSKFSADFADTSATSNSSRRRKSISGNQHHENASRNDTIFSMASADGSVVSNCHAGRTADEAERSEAFYTPDEDSRLSSISKSFGRGPENMDAKDKKGANTPTDKPNQDSSLSFTTTGDEPTSYAAIDNTSEADQQSMQQTMNSQSGSMSMYSTGLTTKRKKKKPKALRKECVEGNAHLSTATDGGEGNSAMSFASAADVSAQGSSTSLIYSSDPAADINKAVAKTIPESQIAKGRRIWGEDRDWNGGRSAVEPPNVLGRPHQWPIPGMSLGKRPAAQSFGGQDSLPMTENVWYESVRRGSMTAAGRRPGPTNLIPGMTPCNGVHLPLPSSQIEPHLELEQSNRRDPMRGAMANAVWRASLPNSLPGLSSYPTVRLPSSGSHIRQLTGPATNINNESPKTINVSVTSPSIVDTRNREPISKAWPTVKQWNGRIFQDQINPE